MTKEQGIEARAAFLKKVNFLTMKEYLDHMTKTGGWGSEEYQKWVAAGRPSRVGDRSIINFEYGVEY